MALYFDEADDYLAVADDSAMDFPDADFMMAGWIRFTSGAGSSAQYIFWRNDPSNAPGWWFLYAEGSTNAGWTLRNSSGSLVSCAGTISVDAGNWHYFELVRDGANMYIYRDGVEVASGSVATAGGIDAPADLIVGVRGSDFSSIRFFGGDLAEWALWQRLPSDDERAALRKGYSPLFFPRGMSFYMPMVRESVERIVPVSVTNNGPVPSSHPPIIYPAGAQI